MPRKLTQEEFIKKAKKAHKDLYDYSKSVYLGGKQKVCIICPIHGEFWQQATLHILGHGCPKCAQVKNVNNIRVSRQEFIERAQQVHGHKYDYSKMEFDTMKKKVHIVCPEHGSFLQTPESHLLGTGCKKCQSIRKRKKICGIGINDYEGQVRVNGEFIQSYNVWKDMIRRCYDEGRLKRHPTYKGVSVCEEWKYFSKFKEWFDEHYVEGWHLDKDVLCNDKKQYSPSNCCFLPPKINSTLAYKKKSNKEYCCGVFRPHANSPFTACLHTDNGNCYLGKFNTQEQAFVAYKRAKEERIRQLAEEFKDQIEPRVYEALMNYKIEITD